MRYQVYITRSIKNHNVINKMAEFNSAYLATNKAKNLERSGKFKEVFVYDYDTNSVVYPRSDSDKR
jgi:hypothetical protein